MKVLLIQPPNRDPWTDQTVFFEPLALESLGAGLKLDGHEVRLLDARLDADIDGALNHFRPDLLVLADLTSHFNVGSLNIVKEIARSIKEGVPGTLVVVASPHEPLCREDFNEAYFDMVVIGEGVSTLREIVHAVETGSRLGVIRGLAIPAPGGMIFSEPRPYTPLAELPFPDLSLTAAYRKYYFSESYRLPAGCTTSCSFCALRAVVPDDPSGRAAEAGGGERRTVAEPNQVFCARLHLRLPNGMPSISAS